MPASSSPHPLSDHLEELITGYVLDALSPEETLEFEQYLAQDPSLESEISRLQEVMGLLAYTSPAIAAPSHLRSKVLAIPQTHPPSATAETATPPQPQPAIPIHSAASRRQTGLQQRRPARRWQSFASLAAAVLVIALGVNNYQLRHQLNDLEHHAQTPAIPFALRGTDPTTAATGKVVLDLETGRALVALENLPPLPTGETYRMWAFTEDKRILCGEFNTSASGQVVGVFEVPVAEYDTPVQYMRVSREAIAASSEPSQKVLVMTSES